MTPLIIGETYQATKSSMANKKKNGMAPVTWAQAFRDIINKSMDRGQLLPILFFLVVIFFIFRMPPEHVYQFGVDVLQGLKSWELVGWLGMAIVTVLWAGHARLMRRKHSAEYSRIGNEKSNLQKNQARPQLGSSDNY
ncbi:hypothetical protein DVV14_13740 [Vibrio coralliilyticus]|nr:hypothetical protein DVV14_13740 [Vibrio coralliilyticus]